MTEMLRLSESAVLGSPDTQASWAMKYGMLMLNEGSQGRIIGKTAYNTYLFVSPTSGISEVKADQLAFPDDDPDYPV
ncbi:hypothetical protein HOD19_04330 [bacterium]|jgi:hypothetical protein|nr:hypothetical protein [bacterium]